MSDGLVIAVELASVYETADRDRLIWILAWGDRVEDVPSGYQRDRAQ